MTDLFHRAEFIVEVVRIIREKRIVVKEQKKVVRQESVKGFMSVA